MRRRLGRPGSVRLETFLGRGAPYENDIRFLLDELETKAGTLLKLKGVDWKAVRGQFPKDVKKVRTDGEHVKLASRLVARLRDGHASLVDLKIKKTVERLSDETGYSTPQMAIYNTCHAGLADWEGTPIDFDLRAQAGKKHIRIVRQGGPNFVPLGPVFPPPGLKPEGRQSYGKAEGGYGYIHLRDVPGELPEQLDRMLEAIGDNGKGIEGIGVAPHEITPSDPEDLLKKVDTQIRWAEEILNAGIPKEKVPFVPAGG